MSLSPAANSPRADCTVRMAALLGRMRRERNGVVADAMRYYGRRYGLNYGVSLPTVRSIARAGTPDHGFARMLWEQDVRELKLAALHLAEPESLTVDEAAWWARGIVNSELAEEFAFALLRRSPHCGAIFAAWVEISTPFLAYAALLGEARSPQLTEKLLPPTLEIIRDLPNLRSSEMPQGNQAHMLAQGAVALLDALGRQNETNRQAVLNAADSFARSADAEGRFVSEELRWRLA
ncbi:MAG: DNA alkylation repair protein [Alistipes senegalensis]|nr:DNA alkylation repair protein [Bacteroides cellulosilyticus]MCM1351779.1 DNA alkylation repair protein [Alistipes senegalensis]